MAGGIDWLRWHHGSVNDPKFQLVARRAGASVAEVIAVWATLLEAASQAEDRGHPGDLDFEAMDCGLGLRDGACEGIYRCMKDRDLIGEDGRLSAWDKRQPKREDRTAADRKRRQREREKDVVPTASRHDVSRNVTQCHDRGEESRVDISPSLRSGDTRKRVTHLPCPEDVEDSTWSDWLALRKAKRAPVTETVVKQARIEAGKAAMSLGRFLEIWCARGSQGLQADWLKPGELAPARAGPEPSKTRSAVETLQSLKLPETRDDDPDVASQRTGRRPDQAALLASG